jgi:hypothetical protein
MSISESVALRKAYQNKRYADKRENHLKLIVNNILDSRQDKLIKELIK